MEEKILTNKNTDSIQQNACKKIQCNHILKNLNEHKLVLKYITEEQKKIKIKIKLCYEYNINKCLTLVNVN
jgi:hypothetical protein